jgi:hypothetical protein
MLNNKSSKSTPREVTIRDEFFDLFRKTPIHDNEILMNLSLFNARQYLSRQLYFNKLYKKFLKIHGVIMQFGVYWGRDLAHLINLRGIYDPYNYLRKIIGFDTFEGIKGFDIEKDGSFGSDGDFSTTEGYENYLEKILQYHENECALAHIKKFELVKGDACETLPKYFEDNPETIIAFAHLDMDIYEPTKRVLELIKPRLVKGSIVAMDELNFHTYSGETLAFDEVFGLNNYKLERVPYDPISSYLVFGGD